MNRLGAKIGCVVVAVVVWVQVASTSVQETVLVLPLELTNVPAGCVVSGAEDRLVRVRLRGSRLRHMAHQFLNRPAGRVEIDLAGEVEGPPIQREVTINDVRSELDILAITPPVRLVLWIDRIETRRVPVVVALVGSLPSDQIFVERPRAVPDSVAVSGPSRFFNDDLAVITEQIDLGHIRGETTLPAKLVSLASGLDLQPGEVDVRLHVSRVAQRLFPNLPVTILRDTGQPAVSADPPVADLVISGQEDSLRVLAPSRLAVTLGLTGLGDGVHEVPGVEILPPGFGLVSMRPEVFSVTIGDPRPADPQGGADDGE